MLTFDDICNENSVSIVEQALGCEELWRMTNGVLFFIDVIRDIERLRTKLRRIFFISRWT